MEPLFQTKRISAVEAEAGDIPFIIRMENAAENRNFIWQGTKEQHLAERQRLSIHLQCLQQEEFTIR